MIFFIIFKKGGDNMTIEALKQRKKELKMTLQEISDKGAGFLFLLRKRVSRVGLGCKSCNILQP